MMLGSYAHAERRSFTFCPTWSVDSESGSPNRSIHRTFRATFEMPVTTHNHHLIKIDKRQYRNPIYLAKEWRNALDKGEYKSPADLSRHLKVSRARVTQILKLLHLSPDVIDMIFALADPLRNPIVTERRLRTLLSLNAEQQKTQLEAMFSKKRSHL